MNIEELPKTQLEAIRYFSDSEVCHDFLVQVRWPNGVECPKCGSKNVGCFSGKRKVCNCKNCKRQFTIKVGSIMEDSPLGLDLWLTSFWILVNAKNGVSSCELGRTLGVKQQTAWFILHRLRHVLKSGTFTKLKGTVEVDESFIGGRARFMHEKDKKRKGITGTGMVGKAAIIGLLERKRGKKPSKIIAEVLPAKRKSEMVGRVKKYVLRHSYVHTDNLNHYNDLEADYVHRVIDHADSYVDGNVHTNGLENFWCLLKRGLRGTYTFCMPFHLGKYLAEQVYRFNERTGDDLDRFLAGCRMMAGQRLTYADLIAKD